MSSQRQADTPFVTLTDGGKCPDRTPAHQLDFDTGISGRIGGSAFGSPMICSSRAKPTVGNLPAGSGARSRRTCLCHLRLMTDDSAGNAQAPISVRLFGAKGYGNSEGAASSAAPCAGRDVLLHTHLIFRVEIGTVTAPLVPHIKRNLRNLWNLWAR